jgi:hypothetical protein
LKVRENAPVSSSQARRNFPTYEDWQRDESRRRYANLYIVFNDEISKPSFPHRTVIQLHLMSMLIDMSMEKLRSPSCSYLDRIALPCSKGMWEAETKRAWELEYKNYLSKRKGSEMLNCGDLRQQLNDQDMNSSASNIAEDLSTWSREVDSFGAMLLLAFQQRFT